MLWNIADRVIREIGSGLYEISKLLEYRDTGFKEFFRIEKQEADYAYYFGRRTEVQFHIAVADLPNVGTVFRYGIGFSVQPGRYLDDPLTVLLQKVALFNAYLAENTQAVSDLKIWCVSSDMHTGPLPASVIPLDWMQPDHFIFIGNYWRKTIDEITDTDIREIMRVFDALMPAYLYVEENAGLGLMQDDTAGIRYSKVHQDIQLDWDSTTMQVEPVVDAEDIEPDWDLSPVQVGPMTDSESIEADWDLPAIKVEPMADNAELELLKVDDPGYVVDIETGEDLSFDSDQEDLLNDPRNVPVWFGTNRLPVNVNDIAKGFGDQWSEATTLGRCIVNVPKGHVPGSVGSSWWVRLVKGDDRLKVVSIESIPDDLYWPELSGQMQNDDSDEALFFLHGYNVSFDDATLRTAQLSYDLRIQPAILFSWPSGGDVDDYAADEAAIEASYDAVVQFVTRLDECTFNTGTTLHVMAHSMGNRALLRALEAISMGVSGGRVSAIDKLIFAAPDVDARVFMQSMNKIKGLGKNKTLYTSQRDKAVWLSRVIHKYARAGLIPPVTILDGLDTIDSTAVDETFLGHSYIASVRALITDLSSLLKAGLPPSKRVGLEVAHTDDGKLYWTIL
jgi:esterase/lipase superfamily enzyme